MKTLSEKPNAPAAGSYRTVLHPNRPLSAVTSLLLVFLLFSAVPLANYLSVRADRSHLEMARISDSPPPAPPAEIEPPPEREKAKADEPELQNKPPPLTLSQIDFILNPGTGSASGDFGISQQLLEFSALAEIQVFELSELDKQPIPIQRIAPVYPYEAKNAGLEGWVKLLFIVDENGSTREIRVDTSSAREFEAAAMDALRLWKFTPGVKDGKNVRTKMLIPFHFRIHD